MSRRRRPPVAFWPLPVLLGIGWAAVVAPEAPEPTTPADEPEARAASQEQGALPTVPSTRPLGAAPPERVPVGAGGSPQIPASPARLHEPGRVLDPQLHPTSRLSFSLLHQTSHPPRGPPSRIV